jgi:hypothetical protein
MLDIFVNTNKLTIKDPIIASDTIEYLTFKVHYESELWEEYDEITAFISNGTTSYSVPVVDGVISEDNKIKVSEGMWTIYIQGTSGGAVVLFTNADILWVTKPGGIEGYPYIKVPADISFQSYLIAKNAEYIASNAGGGGSLAGEGGFKIIGFTESCNYIATAEDGHTAFTQALEEASDGDTILVMPGVYKGNSQYLITKNINFVGVGKPEIDFPVKIQGGGVFSYENWEWAEVYPSITSKWHGFKFTKPFSVGGEANPDGQTHHGNAIVDDCDFVCTSVSLYGTFTKCRLEANSVSVATYYGGNAKFVDCKIVVNSFYSYSEWAYYDKCEFYFTSDTPYIDISATDFNGTAKYLTGCKMYAPGRVIEFNNGHASGYVGLNDTLVFADDITGVSYGGYIIELKPHSSSV